MGIREVMVIVGGKSVGDVVELLADGAHFGLDLTYRYQRGRARDRPRDRPRPRLRRRRRVLLRARRQHPARRRRWPTSPAEFEAGPWAAGTLLYRVPDPERFGVAELDADGRVVGFEEKPAQPEERPDPDRRLLPAAGRVRRHRPPRAVGPRRVRDHRRPQPLHPRRPPLQPGLRGPLDGRRARSTSLLRAAELARDDDHAGNLAPPVERPVP